LQALDTFNTAIVSPIYYVMFTSLTILASVIMFKVSSAPTKCIYGCMRVLFQTFSTWFKSLWFWTGLGSAKRYSNCYRNMWICYNTFRHFSSPQNKGHGRGCVP